MLKLFGTLNKFERTLFCVSVVVVTLSYTVSHGDLLLLIASLIGVTSLIFIAKGNVAGQILTIVFSVIYGYISFKFKYYGEMITYVGMTLPSAAFAVYTWVKNPYKKNQVKVASLEKSKVFLLWLGAAAVTGLFFFILRALGTKNMFFGTVSVTTSFLASMLLCLRSPFYAIAYAANDVILITLWTLAAIEDISYLPMVFCFAMFLFNDIYGFISWRAMSARQKRGE